MSCDPYAAPRRRPPRLVSQALSIAVFLPMLAAGATDLVILPGQIKLTGPEARQQLLLEQVRDQQFVGQFTNTAEFFSSDPSIVRIENRAALPVKNGQATISVKAGKFSARAPVTVAGMEKSFDWSFRNHIQPVLAKNGCSAGACHGAAAGQNGFKLSLRGYDDEGDFLTLTHGALGRRIVPSDPGRSLILLKPTGAVPHKGGKRFDVDCILSEATASRLNGTVPLRRLGPSVVRGKSQPIILLTLG